MDSALERIYTNEQGIRSGARPDAHVAALLPWPGAGPTAADVYRRITYPDAPTEEG